MKRLFLVTALIWMGLYTQAQNLIISDPITVFEGDTVKIVNYESLLTEDLFKDKKGMKGWKVTTLLDIEETDLNQLASLLDTTEFTAMGIEKRNLGESYFTMKNLSTEEIYGIRMKKSVQLENYVINLTQQKKASKEQYERNLAAEKEMRGEWDKRITVVPNNIDYDIAAWNEKRMAVIQGKEFAFADIIGYEVASRDTYRTDGIDHQNLVKNFKKKQGLGTLITGQVGVLAGTISAVAGGVNDLIQNTDLITIYTVNVRTAIQSYPTIEINVGTDEAKANEVVQLINAILASNEALKAE